MYKVNYLIPTANNKKEQHSYIGILILPEPLQKPPMLKLNVKNLGIFMYQLRKNANTVLITSITATHA